MRSFPIVVVLSVAVVVGACGRTTNKNTTGTGTAADTGATGASGDDKPPPPKKGDPKPAPVDPNKPVQYGLTDEDYAKPKPLMGGL